MTMFRDDIKGLITYAVVSLLLILLVLVFFSYGHVKEKRASISGATAKLKVAGTVVTVELASTSWEHQRGLKHRHGLPEDHGMLFIFPEENYRAFWMKDTYIPISIAFISEGGIITQIDSMEPLSLRSHNSKEKVKYALEMRGGWFERYHIKVGDRVELPSEVPKN